MRSIIAALTLISSIGAARADEMEGRGRIMNEGGFWCWFTQTLERKTPAFLGPRRARIATMTFDDPDCMTEIADDVGDVTGIVNRSIIAQRIAGLVRGSWVTEDTVYDSRNRNQPGVMQEAGECMVADDLPATAIAINFVSDGASITDVEYAHVYGCGDPLPRVAAATPSN